MWVSVESCQGGFLLEVRTERTDPTYLVMPGQTDWKKVVTTYAEVETYLRKMFCEKSQTVVTHVMDHGKKENDPG